MAKILNNVQLAAQIRSVKSNSGKLREQIHTVLVSCAYHAVKDGQITPFNNLLDAVEGTVRVKGITIWAETFGFVRVKEERFVLNKSQRSEADIKDEEDFARYLSESGADDTKWFDMVPKETVKSMFDLDTYAQHVEKKLTAEGYIGLAEAVKELIQQYHAEQNAEISAHLKAIESEGV